MMPSHFLVFDVESVGLHGDAFAFGYVLINALNGKEIGHDLYWCEPGNAGNIDDRRWVAEHVPMFGDEFKVRTPEIMRALFWKIWMGAKTLGDAWLAADVSWPVESRFLNACIADDPRRAQRAPYPLIDIASIRFSAGFDPLETSARALNERPPHNPEADARQSARLLMEALQFIHRRSEVLK